MKQTWNKYLLNQRSQRSNFQRCITYHISKSLPFLSYFSLITDNEDRKSILNKQLYQMFFTKIIIKDLHINLVVNTFLWYYVSFKSFEIEYDLLNFKDEIIRLFTECLVDMKSSTTNLVLLITNLIAKTIFSLNISYIKIGNRHSLCYMYFW